jgi:arabinose-5-phosphate isomerase
MPLQLHQPAGSKPSASSAAGRLQYGREVLRAESATLELVAQRLDETFLRAVELLLECSGTNPGRVVVTGTGKSADVGQKIAGTLNSTGTRAYVLDATRAVHGDLGMVHPSDVALVLSHSGESEEVLRLLPPLRSLLRSVVAITGNAASTLARKADLALVYGPLDEVCPLGLAPSASTTAMLALGDALAFVLSREREFTHEDFARFHPAGSLGRKLTRVEAMMRHGEELRLARETETVREVFAQARKEGRRTGAVMLLDEAGRLAGLFTDSDLARLIEERRDAALDQPIAQVMKRTPFTVTLGDRVGEALDLLRRHKISELPVVDAEHRPVGLVDITDLVALAAGPEDRGKVRLGA